MTGPPKLPDLAKLTDAQKDQLIVSLWQTLIATDAVTPAQPAAVTVDQLRDRIRHTPPRRTTAPITVRGRLGSGLGFLESKLLLGVLFTIGFAFIADFAVSWYQQHELDARHRAALELQDAAFGGLNLELVRVEYEPDGTSYRATIDMQNSNLPLYIMLSPVRVFEQVGLTWQEVPAQAPPGASWGVIKLVNTDEYKVVFRTDAKNWAELMPGYMHIRIQSGMLISRRSEPRDDIVERNNSFYVYLKPQDADGAAIKRRANFPGTPPIFIPMPPH